MVRRNFVKLAAGTALACSLSAASHERKFYRLEPIPGFSYPESFLNLCRTATFPTLHAALLAVKSRQLEYEIFLELT
jgi:hypothetical protein